MKPSTQSPPSVLCLSGSDPSGGAGLQADLKTLHRHGVHGMAIPTLLTAQNASGVKKVVFLDPGFFEQQWNALFENTPPAAIKIGAIGSRKMALKIVKLLSSPKVREIPVVLDPVLGSTSGASLLEQSALPVLIDRLFPLCRVVTPNVPEFSLLSGEAMNSKNAVSLLRDFGEDKSCAILLKGGHLKGPDSTDWLSDHGHLYRFTQPRLSVKAHGTGCALASSIAANLARGCELPEACGLAKTFVHKALANSHASKKGSRLLNLWV